jgi:hypothetical protein
MYMLFMYRTYIAQCIHTPTRAIFVWKDLNQGQIPGIWIWIWISIRSKRCYPKEFGWIQTRNTDTIIRCPVYSYYCSRQLLIYILTVQYILFNAVVKQQITLPRTCSAGRLVRDTAERQCWDAFYTVKDNAACLLQYNGKKYSLLSRTVLNVLSETLLNSFCIVRNNCMRDVQGR